MIVFLICFVKELQACAAVKSEAEECINCRELQATREELDRIKVLTQLGAEEINRKLAEQDKQFELQLDIYRTQIGITNKCSYFLMENNEIFNSFQIIYAIDWTTRWLQINS